jgi:hypothetical protein
MFTNRAEAERAARAASRITGRKAEVWPDADRGLAVGFADESRAHLGYISWDELADFLAAGYRPPREDQTDKRAGPVAEADAYVKMARAIVASRNGDRDQAIVALTHAIDKLLEALA